MAIDTLSQNPFAVLTIIAAPAVLTNATSVLALSTSNRFLRASERMRSLSSRLETEAHSEKTKQLLLTQVNRVEKQAMMLLSGLRAAYVALGCFVSASLISVVGAILASLSFPAVSQITVLLALAAGFVGAGGIVWACTHLFQATRISMQNITEEAALIRERDGHSDTGTSS